MTCWLHRTDGARLRADHNFVWPRGQVKLYSALAILLEGCGNIQVGDLNLARPGAFSPVVGFGVDGSADNRIAAYIFGTAIAINQDCRRRFFRDRCGWWWTQL